MAEELLSEKVVFLLLGWALGLLGPIMTGSYSRYRDRRELRRALRNEMQDLRFRLAAVVQTLATGLGTIDKVTLEWFSAVIRDYDGMHAEDKIHEFGDKLRELTDEQISEFSRLVKLQAGVGLALKKYSAPLLDEKLGQLSSLSIDLQSQLLDVRASLSLFNEEVDLARFYFQLTFSNSVSGANFERAVGNLNKCYENAAARAKILVNLIGKMNW